MGFGGFHQAKSDNFGGADQNLRGWCCHLRRLCRNMREACRILRITDRTLRESHRNSDSEFPICSIYVLFVFLQPFDQTNR